MKAPKGLKGRLAFLPVVGVAILGAALILYSIQPAAQERACTDSDQGSLPVVQGTCNDGNEFEDFCVVDSVLREYSCIGGRCSGVFLNCETLGMGCVNGTCARVNRTIQQDNITGGNLSAFGNQTAVERMPDLIVRSVGAYVRNATGANDSRVFTLFVYAAIENVGDKPAYQTRANISATGTGFYGSFADTPPVLVGKMEIVEASFTVANRTGTYSITVSADFEDSLRERSEANNVNTATAELR